MAQTLADIRRLLQRHALAPKHKWGQNFLHDQNHMQRIVEAAALKPGAAVLEVGAGTGALTEHLLEAGARVLAVEIDPAFQPILEDRLSSFGERITLHIGDILADKRTLEPAVMQQLPTPFTLIGNLPYNVASPLLSTLALDHPAMQRAVVMVQREVADRLTATPGNKQYGPLGILVQAMCEAKRISTLPASCFWPQPKVGSAVVSLERRGEPMTDDPPALARLVQTLFTKRRKQLGSILGRNFAWPAEVNPTDRPEQLRVDQLVALSQMTRGDQGNGGEG